jgi:hypothetical protein
MLFVATKNLKNTVTLCDSWSIDNSLLVFFNDVSRPVRYILASSRLLPPAVAFSM